MAETLRAVSASETISISKKEWGAHVESAIALIQQNQHEQALAEMLEAERLAPNERDVRYWLANAHRMTGGTERALEIFRELLSARPDDVEVSFAAAFLLREAGRPAEAGRVLLEASEQAGLSTHQLLQITGFLRDSNQHAAAIEVLEKVMQLSPGETDLQFKLGRLYQATGQFDRALESLRKTLDTDPSTGPAWTLLAQQKRFESTDDPDYTRMLDAASKSLGSEADMCLRFALGKALDDLQQWSPAWEKYREGNELMARTSPWDQRAWDTFVERSIESSGQALAAAPATGRKAVFVVGMPRSGTTLLEQMLDRHPNISGRGELGFLANFAGQTTTWGRIDESHRAEMANILWTQMRLEGREDGAYIDKNPLNFRFLGILFELLPTAKVLHVTRDGRDSCLSCFFQLFEQTTDTAFSYALDHLVAFYAGYRRLMAHWEQVYPQNVHRVRYEDLVDSPESVLADALRFLDVEWHDAVTSSGESGQVVRTASVWQARQPVYKRSVGRWRHYADQAPDFFARIAEIDASFDH
ncbi:MAG: sulfotransferase [Woeseiaceae bacterium]|nr:sulfotransferase [Woeseiaceae bacterium]